MVNVKVTDGKYTPRKKTIAVKDVFITNGKLTDDSGSDVLDEISRELPEDVKYFSFKLSFEIPDEMIL